MTLYREQLSASYFGGSSGIRELFADAMMPRKDIKIRPRNVRTTSAMPWENLHELEHLNNWVEKTRVRPVLEIILSSSLALSPCSNIEKAAICKTKGDESFCERRLRISIKEVLEKNIWNRISDKYLIKIEQSS